MHRFCIKKELNELKNKRIRFALRSDLANFAVDKATGLARERFK